MIEINVFRAMPRPQPGIGGENDDETFHVSFKEFRVQNSKDSQWLPECKILVKTYASERARAGQPQFFGERASASSTTSNFWRASELARSLARKLARARARRSLAFIARSQYAARSRHVARSYRTLALCVSSLSTVSSLALAGPST
jgi:hypothetical protein